MGASLILKPLSAVKGGLNLRKMEGGVCSVWATLLAVCWEFLELQIPCHPYSSYKSLGWLVFPPATPYVRCLWAAIFFLALSFFSLSLLYTWNGL